MSGRHQPTHSPDANDLGRRTRSARFRPDQLLTFFTPGHMIHWPDDEAARKWEEFQNQATGGAGQQKGRVR